MQALWLEHNHLHLRRDRPMPEPAPGEALTGCDLRVVGRHEDKLALLAARGITVCLADDVQLGRLQAFAHDQQRGVLKVLLDISPDTDDP